MRVVVVQPPRDHLLAADTASPIGDAPLAVGLLHWFDPKPAISVVVKATFSLAGDAVLLASDQEPISGDVVRATPWQPDELYYPSDFVPFKPDADLLLVGQAYAESGQPATEISARVALGEWRRTFTAVVSEPSATIPLAEPYLRSTAGHPLGPVGPFAQALDDVEKHLHADDLDYGLYNVAPGEQRTELFQGARTLELRGLSPKGERCLTLPPWLPRVRVSFRGPTPDDDVPMLVDTVWIDTDAQRCILVWRGQSVRPHRSHVDRLCVSLEDPDDERDWEEILRPAGRGDFSFAAQPSELDTAARDEAEEHALTMARYEAIAGPRAAEPTISLEQYATVSAELAEQREGRAVVLERHGFDENIWLVEERGWLEKMSERATAGDGTLVARYGELFVAAQDELASEAETDVSVADYAKTLVALELGDDPARELEQRKLTLAVWLRLDRRFRKVLDEDEVMAAEFERLAAAERAKRAAGGAQD